MNITVRTYREAIADELPVIEAFSQGRQIQELDLNGRWIDTDKPKWGDRQHRIKPEPRELWIVRFSEKCHGVYESRRDAEKRLATDPTATIHHMREVLP